MRLWIHLASYSCFASTFIFFPDKPAQKIAAPNFELYIHSDIVTKKCKTKKHYIQENLKSTKNRFQKSTLQKPQKITNDQLHYTESV